MNYHVTFIKYYYYDVEATDEDDAVNVAEAEFRDDMRSPIADTVWDDVEVEEDEYTD